MANNGSAFNQASHYRFSKPSMYPNYTISSGLIGPAPPGIEVTMEPTGALSSNNWQIFFSFGSYFIRNYDSNASLQLDLTEDNTVIPQLLNSSGTLGQQWHFQQRSDGSWGTTDEITGKNTALRLGLSSKTPGMDVDDSDSLWAISINVGAEMITDESMLASVQNVETSTPITASVTTARSNPASSTLSSKHLLSSISGGATAGIVIAVIAAFSIAPIMVFILRRRRKASTSYVQSSIQLPQPPPPPSELDGKFVTAMGEVENRVPRIGLRVELS